ncbi:hypothetical protein [Burkholderia cepacia]|uniref:hypothetical protein n=1 Tax=Burkholderia cepacia TaxID=292 RepID=UPI00128DA8B6|nr:hypothetical protein [Burkholderia cepacia]
MNDTEGGNRVGEDADEVPNVIAARALVGIELCRDRAMPWRMDSLRVGSACDFWFTLLSFPRLTVKDRYESESAADTNGGKEQVG